MILIRMGQFHHTVLPLLWNSKESSFGFRKCLSYFVFPILDQAIGSGSSFPVTIFSSPSLVILICQMSSNSNDKYKLL